MKSAVSLLAISFAAATVGACAGLDAVGSAGDGFGGAAGTSTGLDGSFGTGGTSGDGGIIVPSTDAATEDAGDAQPVAVDLLCGEGCLPDEVMSCADFQPDQGAGGAPQMGPGAAGSSGAAGSAGSAGAPAGDAGAFDSGSSDSGNAVPPPPDPPFACQVRRAAGVATSRCEAAGLGAAGSPCTASSDCAAGLGCVGAVNAGQCRPFCCGGDDACEAGSFCARRDLRDDAEVNVDSLTVPVCVQADDCSLGEPYPCPAGQSCTCEEGKACSIVREDGTTSCVAPGGGIAGDECPCAAGHVCSRATNKCLKLCRINASANECGSGTCQGTSNFPDGFGVCVGAVPDAG